MSRRRKALARWVALASLGAFAGGCAALGLGGSGLSGRLVADERVALPPGATARIELVDVAEADGERAVVASTRVAAERLPLRFALPLEAGVVQMRPYAVRAAIEVDGELWMMSVETVPVLTAGHPRRVDIPLIRVPRGDGEGRAR